MAFRLGMVVILLLLCMNWPVGAVSRYSPPGDLKAEAERAFNQALDLWRDGQFALLYERSQGGSETREGFERRLAAAPFRPACCWEKLQDVSVRLQGDSVALLKGKVGLEGRRGTEFRTRSFRLVKEDDGWLLSRADIISLAGGRK